MCEMCDEQAKTDAAAEAALSHETKHAGVSSGTKFDRETERHVAGALYAFAGLLTTLPKEHAVSFSGAHDASPAVDMIQLFAERFGINISDPDLDAFNVVQRPPTRSFLWDLTALINRYSLENGSDTPDFILAQMIQDTLGSFNKAMQRRATWYGSKAADGATVVGQG